MVSHFCKCEDRRVVWIIVLNDKDHENGITEVNALMSQVEWSPNLTSCSNPVKLNHVKICLYVYYFTSELVRFLSGPDKYGIRKGSEGLIMEKNPNKHRITVG